MKTKTETPHRRFLFLLILFTWALSPCALSAQNFGFQLPRGSGKVEIPFKYNNGFIIVDFAFNGIFPMRFVFDTGAEYSILTKKNYAAILGLKYSRAYKILGSDMTTELTAYLIRGITLTHAGLAAENQDIFVLKDDYFRFEEYIGEEIHGIIGANFFRNYIVEINFQKSKLIFYSPKGFTKRNLKGFSQHKVEINDNKPYLPVKVKIPPSTETEAKLLVDTGASLGLLLHIDSTSNIQIPQKVIPGKVGTGLGGELIGYLGRIQQLSIQEYEFDNLISSFQEINLAIDTSFLNGRNGLLGNRILEKFTLIIDYINGTIFFQPNKQFGNEVKFDRSGLYLIASGDYLGQFTVQSVLPSSPAALAGIQKGDKILSINRLSSSVLTLKNIDSKLQKKIGKKIRLKVDRNGEKKVFLFRLKDLI